VFWAINRSMDAHIGADYFSKRGWAPQGEFRARPSQTSFVDLNYFSVLDRGFGDPHVNQGGEEVRLTAEGELGPVYGAQWRTWRGPSGETFDQVAALVQGIRTRPASRRHIINAWNVAYLPDESKSPALNAAEGKMALAPCHVMYQFYVNDGRLSCMMSQRSCDVYLGLPYNVASTAFLTCMVAQQCELEPGEVVYSLGDAHLYLNHLEQARLQLGREPRATVETVRMGKKKMWASSEKAERELGWNTIPVEGALRRSVEWFRTNGYA